MIIFKFCWWEIWWVTPGNWWLLPIWEVAVQSKPQTWKLGLQGKVYFFLVINTVIVPRRERRRVARCLAINQKPQVCVFFSRWSTYAVLAKSRVAVINPHQPPDQEPIKVQLITKTREKRCFWPTFYEKTRVIYRYIDAQMTISVSVGKGWFEPCQVRLQRFFT